MWDSGADISIIDRLFAMRAIERGAIQQPLARECHISGIKNQTMVGYSKLIATIRMRDGKPRKIEAVIVDGLCCELIIGIDFMYQERIAFRPRENKTFELVDTSSKNMNEWQVIYDSAIDPTQTQKTQVDDNSFHIKSANVTQVGEIRLGSKQDAKLQRQWEALDHDRREMICLLNRLRLSDKTIDEIQANEKRVIIQSEDELIVPPCDFPEYQDQLQALILENKAVFSVNAADVGKSKTSRRRKIQLRLTSDKEVNVKNYRCPLKLRPTLKMLIDDLIEAGIVEECLESDFNSPCMLVPKKAPPGKCQYRLVIDFRQLNKVLENVTYPIPRIQDILVEFHGCNVLSDADMTHAFFTLEIDENSRKLTAFSCELGKWQFKALPQGLKISPAVFQRQIDEDLHDLNRVRVYIDDILCGDMTPEEHLKSLDKLFKRLIEKGYKLSFLKCHFMRKSVEFVGHQVTSDGIGITDQKKEAASKLQEPKTLSQVKSLLGFTSFLRAHIPYYCDVVQPIQDFLTTPGLTKEADITTLWTKRHQLAFDTLKKLLVDGQVLSYPNPDKPFVLYTDASKSAMSGVLMQSELEPLPTVVKLRRRDDKVIQDCDVYIGREVKHEGSWNLDESKWANPYKIAEFETREECLAKYETHIRNTPELWNSLDELRGKTLGCWCKPEGCHGDVLVKLIHEREIEKFGPHGNLKPIGYWSKSFKGAQLNWSALEKEARAVKEAIEHFRVFITGCQIELRCDHKPLEQFLHRQTKNEKVNRWSMEIQQFDIKFKWVSSDMNISDCLSRLNATELFQEHDTTCDDFPEKPKRRGLMPNQVNQEVDCELLAGAAQIDEQDDILQHYLRPSQLTPQQVAQYMGHKVVDVRKISKLSDKQFEAYQEHDNYCKRIKAHINTAKEDNGLFVVHNNLLYRCYLPSDKNENRAGLALVIPKVLWLSVTLNLHLECIHPGRDKMLQMLRGRVYWKNMSKYVDAFQRACPFCQQGKLKQTPRVQYRVQPPAGPGLKLAIDLWSINGKSALTAIDLHSQYPFVEPIENKEAETVCEAMQNILAQMRTPNEIVSDNGTEFKNIHFRELTLKRNIKHTFVAPRSPQSNGVIERFHRFLNETYRKTKQLSKKVKWWPVIRAAVETYRKLPHTATGEAPIFLFAGQEPTYCIDHLLPTLARANWHNKDVKLNLQELWVAQTVGRRNLILARKKNRDQPGAEKHHNFQIGDRVYLQRQQPLKHQPRWEYGYRIVGMESDHTFIIRRSRDGKTMRANLRHLRWCDPMVELIENSSVNMFPGRSQLYFTEDDIADLNWETTVQLPPLDPKMQQKMDQILAKRNTKLYDQPKERKRKTDSSDSDPVPSKRMRKQTQRYVATPVYLKLCLKCPSMRVCKHRF